MEKPYSWRPTLAYEMTKFQPLNEYQIPNQIFRSSGISANSILSPNLVKGYEKHPEHAAKIALYSRHTPGEWVDNCLSKYSESNTNR